MRQLFFLRRAVPPHMLKCARKISCEPQQKLASLIFKNPILDLQQYLELPILTKEDTLFEPSFENMKQSLDLFCPKKDHEIKYITSAIDPKKFPCHDLPEVAFLGRSNSGKSSLLKAIFYYVPDMRIQTSKKPGHTISLKFYEVGTCMYLVDMPGYGYRQPEWFESSVIYYLKNRKNLLKTFLLIDCKDGYHDWDDASVKMLEDFKIPFAVVLTKIDAVPDSQRLKNLLHLKNIINKFHTNTCFPQIFMLSSCTHEGLAYFLAFINHITGNQNKDIS